MNDSFWTWVIVAGIGALALVLLVGLGGPDEEDVGYEPEASETASYWEPLELAQPSSWAEPQMRLVPCPSCGILSPISPCVSCASSRTAPCGLIGGCPPGPSSPCAAPPCSGFETACGSCPSMCEERPRINRNMPMCIDECAFVQMHSTLPYPYCRGVRFEWSATRGHFLDPSANAPLYYAPVTHLPGGENVWIVLTMTDSGGNRYTDQLELHVNNVR